MPLRPLRSHNRLTSTVLAAAAFMIVGSSPLPAQRLSSSGVSVVLGALHTDAAGNGASFTGGYVLANNHLALMLSPLDLGIGLGPEEGYHEATELGAVGNGVCRDRSGAPVSSVRCNASFRYGASAQIIGLLATDSQHAIGVGAGYRAFDAAGPYAIASIELATVRDARLHFRVRGGSHFYDLAIGATFSLERLQQPQRPDPE